MNSVLVSSVGGWVLWFVAAGAFGDGLIVLPVALGVAIVAERALSGVRRWAALGAPEMAVVGGASVWGYLWLVLLLPTPLVVLPVLGAFLAAPAASQWLRVPGRQFRRKE